MIPDRTDERFRALHSTLTYPQKSGRPDSSTWLRAAKLQKQQLTVPARLLFIVRLRRRDEVGGIEIHADFAFGNRSLQYPANGLSQHSLIRFELPVFVKVQAAETERPPAIRAFPGPSDSVVFLFNLDLDEAA